MSVKEYKFEELSVGLTESLTSNVTLEDVENFAALSGDVSPIHVSEEFAKSRGFPGRIAHGLLIGARISALIGTKLPGKNGILQSCDLEFRSPLVPPDLIEITGEITGISEGTGQIILKIHVRNSSGKLIAVSKARTILRKSNLNLPSS